MVTGGIWKEKIKQAKRNCKIGDRVKVFNHWSQDKHNQNARNSGKWEYARIIKKFKHIVILDNRRCVDYAELALQRR